MNDLIILGVGVHGAEMAEMVERLNRVEPTWNLLGFIAPGETAPCDVLAGYPVLGTRDDLLAYPQTALVPDYAWPRSLPVPRDRLVSLIDPSAVVSPAARTGAGTVIYPHCYVSRNVTLGDYVFCLSGSVMNHDVLIEDRVTLASGVALAGHVHVEPDCYLGQACTCRQGVRIGRGALIGMGAVVVRDVAPNSVMVGNPARKLRDRRDGDP